MKELDGFVGYKGMKRGVSANLSTFATDNRGNRKRRLVFDFWVLTGPYPAPMFNRTFPCVIPSSWSFLKRRVYDRPAWSSNLACHELK